MLPPHHPANRWGTQRRDSLRHAGLPLVPFHSLRAAPYSRQEPTKTTFLLNDEDVRTKIGRSREASGGMANSNLQSGSLCTHPLHELW